MPGPHHRAVLERAAQWAGLHFEDRQWHLLERFAGWLVEEAIPAGGLGPSEEPLLFTRHLADSLLFGTPWKSSPCPPGALLDVGAGVGLPGLPLAIAWPGTEVTLLDRSARRADLARRAVRVLGLSNVGVATAQVQEWKGTADLIVCRAVASPTVLRKDLARLLRPNGKAVVGGSHRVRPQATGYQVREVPASIIGYPVWLLIMNET